MKKRPEDIAIDFMTSDLMSAFKIGIEEGLLNASLRHLVDITDMSEKCFQVYRQGYNYGAELYMRTMEEQCTK